MSSTRGWLDRLSRAAADRGAARVLNEADGLTDEIARTRLQLATIATEPELKILQGMLYVALHRTSLKADARFVS